ncbi:MAG: hypothetical protein ACOC8D_03165 [bacterium]
MLDTARTAACLLALAGSVAGAAGTDPQEPERFPLTRGRFGTLGAPANRQAWERLGACWFKAGDCYWPAAWVPGSDVQVWLLVRPRMFFTGNNRVWNPAPKPPQWAYRDKVKRFLRGNHARVGIVALGNSICYADIESGYEDAEEYVTWYHEVVEPQTFIRKIRAMRAFMKRAGLRDTAFVITEMGVFNHCCEPKLTEAQLIEFMRTAIEFMEGPDGVDKELGMPSDGYRLVQKWSYSAFPHLVKDGHLTPMGQVYRHLLTRYADRAITGDSGGPTPPPEP